jgi:ankyrin repeat protein
MGFDPTEILLEDGDLPPLYQALHDRNFDLAARLITEGAKLDDIIENDGNTFLHDAAQAGDLMMVDFFLDHECPATIESFDYISNTPLIRASHIGRTEVVVRLLAARVNPNSNDEERIGNTAIREAVRGGHTEIVSLLLRSGADPTIPGWMNISAVDQAWYSIEGTHETMREIRALLARYPSSLRDKQTKQNKPHHPTTRSRPV